jgi:DNA-binding Xre family transcriptional regulator
LKITSVAANARRRSFEVEVRGEVRTFPYAKCDPRPESRDPVVEVFVDPELGNEAFTFRLKSGVEGSVHLDQVLDYNRDPSYLRDMLVYKLTLAAQRLVAATPLSKRELIRRLGTSPAQLYRLLDQTNYAKSVDQLLRLLTILECEVDLVVHAKSA